MQEDLLEEFESKPMEKPQTVKLSVKLLIVSIAIAVLNFLSTLLSANPAVSFASMSAGFVFGILILSFLVYQINAGKNWARILLVVLIVIGMFTIPLDIIAFFKFNQLLAIIISVQTIIELAAVGLLMTKQSNEWFKAKK